MWTAFNVAAVAMPLNRQVLVKVMACSLNYRDRPSWGAVRTLPGVGRRLGNASPHLGFIGSISLRPVLIRMYGRARSGAVRRTSI
jgi:hypothetical protein